jgi:uncharacterized iron-regulated protein
MTTFVSEKCAGKNRKKNKPYLKSVTSKLVENTKAVIKKRANNHKLRLGISYCE